MTRFFFHLQLHDGGIADDQGEDFTTLAEAVDHAQVVVSELTHNAPEASFRNAVLVVANDAGDELSKLSMEQAAEEDSQGFGGRQQVS